MEHDFYIFITLNAHFFFGSFKQQTAHCLHSTAGDDSIAPRENEGGNVISKLKLGKILFIAHS